MSLYAWIFCKKLKGIKLYSWLPFRSKTLAKVHFFCFLQFLYSSAELQRLLQMLQKSRCNALFLPVIQRLCNSQANCQEMQAFRLPFFDLDGCRFRLSQQVYSQIRESCLWVSLRHSFSPVSDRRLLIRIIVKISSNVKLLFAK